MFHLSKKDFDRFQPYAEKALSSVGAGSDSRVIPILLASLERGEPRVKLIEKLAGKMDPSKAEKVVDKIGDALESFYTSKKRREEPSRFDENSTAGIKQPKLEQPPSGGGGGMNDEMVRQMMEKAKEEIRRKAAALSIPPVKSEVVETKPSPLNTEDSAGTEKAKRAADLQARIQERFNANPSIAAALQKFQSHAAVAQSQSQGVHMDNVKPKGKIIVDAQGRTIDAATGEVIELQHHVPTLKANIRAQKRQHLQTVMAETEKQVKQEVKEEASTSSFFDPRVAALPKRTTKRGKLLKFHEQGKFVKQANTLRLKRQLEKLQSEIAQSARKTGITAVAKLAIAQPRIDATTAATPDQVPALEWWDATILRKATYEELPQDEVPSEEFEGISNLVEHPIQAQAPDIKVGHVVKIPLYLTKKERKKLRRQNRKALQQEEQEKIKLGLLPPPEPKVKISNLMRVLGNDAVADPTKIEQRVRQQMAKRQKEHETANKERQLTAEERKQKRERKLLDDSAVDVNVAVYRVRDLSNPSKKFKVETNAKQLLMTGFICLSKDCNVVVVEGNAKQQKKFKQLMINRIKWSEDPVREWSAGIGKKQLVVSEPKEGEEEKAQEMNSCDLVWEGTAKKRAFGDVIFKICQTETAAREQFKKHNVEQYWDLAYSTSVLSEAFSR